MQRKAKEPIVLDALWCADGVWRVSDVDADAEASYWTHAYKVGYNEFYDAFIGVMPIDPDMFRQILDQIKIRESSRRK